MCNHIQVVLMIKYYHNKIHMVSFFLYLINLSNCPTYFASWIESQQLRQHNFGILTRYHFLCSLRRKMLSFSCFVNVSYYRHLQRRGRKTCEELREKNWIILVWQYITNEINNAVCQMRKLPCWLPQQCHHWPALWMIKHFIYNTALGCTLYVHIAKSWIEKNIQFYIYSKSSVFINSKRVQFNLQEAAEAVVIQFHKFDIFYYSFLQNIDTHHVHILQSIDFLTF